MFMKDGNGMECALCGARGQIIEGIDQIDKYTPSLFKDSHLLDEENPGVFKIALPTPFIGCTCEKLTPEGFCPKLETLLEEAGRVAGHSGSDSSLLHELLHDFLKHTNHFKEIGEGSDENKDS